MKISIQKIFTTASIIILLLNFVISANATKIGTFTTSINGGIASSEYNFTPYICFKGDTPLFSNRVITAADEGITFIIASDLDDVNYAAFIDKLTNDTDEMLTIGHKIGKVKSDISNKESNWFNNSNGSKDKITFITIRYTNLKFEPSLDTPNKWTNFSYQLTLSIFNDDNSAFSDDDSDGIDFANTTHDDDNDGIDFASTTHDDDNDGIDFAFVDYETVAQMGSTFTSKGASQEGMTIKKTQEGIFIMIKKDPKNLAISKKSVRILFISSTLEK
ncbi:MAG: hypothetical protein ACJA1N_002796 [Saprospiraceae bacterium]|jgi:hypothetical protein